VDGPKLAPEQLFTLQFLQRHCWFRCVAAIVYFFQDIFVLSFAFLVFFGGFWGMFEDWNFKHAEVKLLVGGVVCEFRLSVHPTLLHSSVCSLQIAAAFVRWGILGHPNS